MSTRGALLLIAPLLGACGQSLAPQSLVSELRILGVRAEPPEAAPGTLVRLDALWADPNGGGRPVHFAWLDCAEIADPRGCLGAAESRVALGGGDRVDSIPVPIPLDAPDGTALVLLAICAGGPARFDADAVRCPDADPLLAFKRILVGRGAFANRNPAMERVWLEAAPWDAAMLPETSPCTPGCAPLAIQIDPAPGSAETWPTTDPLCPATGIETLTVSWFATAGAFSSIRSDAVPPRVSWTAPDAPTTSTFWFVLRDGRGGVDWTERRLNVR